jgi:hypothetical protein
VRFRAGTQRFHHLCYVPPDARKSNNGPGLGLTPFRGFKAHDIFRYRIARGGPPGVPLLDIYQTAWDLEFCYSEKTVVVRLDANFEAEARNSTAVSYVFDYETNAGGVQLVLNNLGSSSASQWGLHVTRFSYELTNFIERPLTATTSPIAKGEVALFVLKNAVVATAVRRDEGRLRNLYFVNMLDATSRVVEFNQRVNWFPRA